MKIKMTGKNLKYILILLGISYVFLMLGNGALSLTNPDEVFYAQTAKEMSQHNTWMTPYIFGQPQFEKPVLLYWLLRIGNIIFGMNNFSGRFFPALFAIAGVIAVYLLSMLGFKNEKKAFISALVLGSSGLYIGLSRTIFTDMVFSVFILFSLLSFYWGYSNRLKKGPGIILFFIFAGLAVLTKGPLGFLVPFSAVLVFLLIKKEARFLFCKYSFWGVLIFLAVSLPWYLLMIKKYGSSFTYEFFYNDHVRRLLEAEHKKNDRWFFYPVSMIAGMFPWSLYVFFSLIYLFKNLRREANPFYLFLASWITVTFLIFQPAHSKLVSYIFPLFPALALSAGNFIYNRSLSKNRSRLLFIISLIMLAFLILIPVALMVALPHVPIHLTSKAPAYILSLGLAVLAILYCFFSFRNKFFKAVFMLSCLVPSILFAAFAIHKDIDPLASSEGACNYLMKNYQVDGPILTAKFFIRGVRYFTDKEAIIVDTPGSFFSPHPVTFINNDGEIINFLNEHPVTYCIFDRSTTEKIMNPVFTTRFSIKLLKKTGNALIFKIEPNKKK